MSSSSSTPKRKKRNLREVFRILGRSHKKASKELDSSKPLLQHLNELRVRIFKALAAVVITTSICFIFSQDMINYLATPIGGKEALVSIEVTENMAIFMRVALLGGVLLAMPVFVYQAMRFLLPGLNQKGKDVVIVWDSSCFSIVCRRSRLHLVCHDSCCCSFSC